jgi:hypothetical protein
MRFSSITRLTLLVIIVFTLFSCKKESEEFQTAPLSDYIPLAVGKYITYRIDSTIFSNFGRNIEVRAYQVKHVLESQITDNQGRASYRVFRYLRDSAGIEGWQAAGSYFITPVDNQVEVTEDNLRFIKLHLPMRDGYSWKGNKYLPADPYGPLFNFSNDDNMEDWDFHYDGEPSSFSYEGIDYADVYSVEEADEAYNVPISDPAAYAAKTRSVEKYAKLIGLVYREYVLWEYQPNTTGTGGPYYTGFGIKMWMIDHN